MNFDSEKYTLHNVSSKIPTPVFSRSASFRMPGAKANLSSSVPNPSAIAENSEYNGPGIWKRNLTPLNFTRTRSVNRNIDDDLESIGSVASNFSTATANSTCEHAHFAKNGTTFSGKSQKYIVHCSSMLTDPEEYLTPTQRANRNIKRLKTLLQLAKEKLREKEEEIFKLNREVVELKLYKATVESVNTSPEIPEKDPLEVPDRVNFSPCEGTSHSRQHDLFSEISPIKHIKASPAKMSPAFSLDGFGDKTIGTPDFLLSSLADSGNFDDLPSSASIYSKDSVSFVATPELRNQQEEENSAVFNDTPGLNDEAEEKLKIVRMYEKKLGEKKLEYEAELNRVINEQEERNMKIIHEFEKKLKEEELKFESRWNELLKATEEEKIMIVNRFEEKLEEERQKYKESMNHFKIQDGSDLVFEMTYKQKVEEEKNNYEASLIDIKEKFERERAMLEEKFDNSMEAERMKFEENLRKIKEIGDEQVAEMTQKVTELEAEYLELVPKYEKAVSRSEELEKENESLKASLKNQEETQRKIYLELYKKGHEAAKLELNGDQNEEPSESSSQKMSVPELFAQLKITEVELDNLKDKEYRAAHTEGQSLCLLSSKEAISLWMLAARKAMYKRLAEAQAKSAQKEKTGSDPEATLQFLKSAVYYFLTDRENHLGHLKAIESILAFSSAEKSNIEKFYLNRRPESFFNFLRTPTGNL